MYRVQTAPAGLKDLLAFHADRTAALPVRPFAPAQVPQVLFDRDHVLFDYNIALRRFVPMTVDELRQVRLAMMGA